MVKLQGGAELRHGDTQYLNRRVNFSGLLRPANTIQVVKAKKIILLILESRNQK